MVKRLLDIALSGVGLALAAPVLALAALGIRLSSPGPVLYRARRVGRAGAPFTMYKLRTMHQRPVGSGSPITGQHDPRVFPLGALLRRTKIDELPQLFNVLRGDMSIVGPRPEDPDIVERHYTALQRETLAVRPGLASPGSLYHYTHGDALLGGAADPQTAYVERLMPLKLALDVVYVRNASLQTDVRIIGRTLTTIAACIGGRSRFRDPPEAPAARALLHLERTTCDTNV
jgi:lipopolysaccharide/colanic/teichoic acid biosynthesis glycosyltransferase